MEFMIETSLKAAFDNAMTGLAFSRRAMAGNVNDRTEGSNSRSSTASELRALPAGSSDDNEEGGTQSKQENDVAAVLSLIQTQIKRAPKLKLNVVKIEANREEQNHAHRGSKLPSAW